MGRFMGGIGGFSARRPVVVLLLWVLVAVGLTLVVRGIGAETSNDLRLPGTDSQAASDLLAERFPPQQNGSSPVVFHATSGKVADGGANQKAVEDTYRALSKTPHVYSATDPFANPQSGLVSADGTYAFIPIILDIDAGQIDDEIADLLFDAATRSARAAGLEVAVGGPVGGELSKSPTESSELIGLIAAMVILTLTFGTLVAMGMPIATAIVGLVSALALVGLLGHLLNVPTVGPTLATMIGLGVGIDYALFLVTRHLEFRADGMEVQRSVARAVTTSGSAIVFAGATVVIALLSLAVAGIPFVTALGYSSALAVFTAVVAAVTLLPALLSLVGDRIDRLALPGFLRPRPRPGRPGVWERWASAATGRPWLAILVALAVMVPLIIPVFSLRLGQEDVGTTPKDTTERRAFDLMSAGFGPGYNGPLLIAAELSPPAAPSDEYTAQYDQATALKSDLEAKQTTLTSEADRLQAEQATLEDEQAELEAQKAQLERESGALEAQEAGLRAQAAALEADEHALRRERDALAAEARRLVASERTLTRQIAALDARIVALEAAIAAASDPVVQAALEADLAEVRGRREALVAQRRTTTTQLRRVARQARQLPAQRVALERRAAVLEAEAVELQREADALSAQAAQLAAEGRQLQAEAAQLQAEADDLKRQQAQAQQEQKQAEALQRQLTTELTKAGGDARGTDPRLVKLQDALGTPDGIQLVSPPNISEQGDASTFTVIPTTRPADPVTASLVRTQRDQVIPAATAEGGITAHVGGSTAANIDLAELITAKLPLVILTVLALSFLLLLIAFRSLLVPVQAALTNLLSVGAAFGILTAAFQWGWAIPVIGPDSPYGTVPIASYVPLMMFAVVFGLSMDYEVFLVSHVQGRHLAGDDARSAVRNGLAASAKVIVAAAAIMISVFGSFILNGDPTIKQFGVGLASAVFLSALMVLLLAPALLVVFGEKTWALPGFLDRILPHMDLEGHAGATATTASEAPVGSPAEPEGAPRARG